MIIKTLYRYERAAGKTTTSPVKPEGKECTEIFRLIADEGKAITKDGVNTFCCVDVEDATGFYEIDEPEAESED